MNMIRNTKRLLCLLLVLTLSVGMLAACGKRENNANETTTAATEGSTDAPVVTGPVAEGDPIELTEEFVLVCGDSQDDAILMLANTLKTKIKAKTGMALSMGFVSTKKDKEIILGYEKGREASVQAYQRIAGGEYTVCVEGTSVVLGAWTHDDLHAAAELFLEQSLVQQDGRWMIYPYSHRQGNVQSAPDLSQYRIVYAADAGSFLTDKVLPRLQQLLLDTFGVSVEAVTDAQAPIDHEIVLGSTNRDTDTIRAYLDGGAQELSYYGHAIVSEGARVHLVARSELALYPATVNLCERTTPEIGPAVFCLNAEPWLSPSADTDDVAELTAGADIRVMSYNILHPSWGNVAVDGRDTNVANILLYYMPDVVGLQETNATWHKALEKILVDTGFYAKACERCNTVAYNMTTFLYNTQTVKLIDEYVIDLDKSSEIRVFSVAVFEKLSDGKRFVVTNTHPAPTGQAENYARNFADLTRIATDELKKYADLPVIMTGDFNTNEQSANYSAFQRTVGVKDAKYEADTLVRNYRTYSGWQKAPIPGNDNCIDHIFVNGNTDVKLFNVVIDHNVQNTSDHIPIYADIALK